jgi:hypothetical protein
VVDGDLASIRLRSVVFDCANPSELGSFYAELLGGEIVNRDPDWVELHLSTLPLKLAFQRVTRFVPPDWPHGQAQQAHLDITVSDLRASSDRAVELGGRPLTEPIIEDNCVFQVHADPSGHPFCPCEDR